MPVPEKKTLDEVMREISNMSQTYKKNLSASEEELKDYVQKELDGKEVDKNSSAARYVADLMARNPKVRKELKSSLPQTDAARKQKMKDLRTAAKRTGWDKLFNDFRGKKKRAAKRELEKIAQDKRRSLNEDQLQTSFKVPSEGRGRHLLTYMVNEDALGSHKQRHSKDPKHQHPTKNKVKDIRLRTSEGRLVGALYAPPKGVPDSGKVVIFFSGSGGTAGEQVQTVLDDYLKMGVSVVSMDYRGFGKSETLSKSGKKKGTPLSEKSMYQDGKDMLTYVRNNMKIKPENIILHGYSMGGAVASKVAADYAQKQQERALEQGRNVKKLGGVVLQSPIATMKEAAYASTMEGQANTFVNRGIAKFMSGGAYTFGGSYNTRSHMRRLHKYDPDMPVHYFSGNIDYEDQLDIDETGINRDPKAAFKNSSSHTSMTGSHESKNMDIENTGLKKMIQEKRADISAPGPKKQAEVNNQQPAL